jgi:hypothetical protein
VEALLKSADDTPLEKVRLFDIQKSIKSLKLRKACGINGIPNECLRNLPRKPLERFTYLFNHCLQLSHFPKSWNGAKPITKISSKFTSDKPVVHYGQTFKKSF